MTDKRFFETDWVYDLETYPNFFSLAAMKADGTQEQVYEISDRKNDTEDLLNFLRKMKSEGCRMVGFNNLGFDYPIIHWILQKAVRAKRSNKTLKLKASQLYDQAQKVIDSSKDDGFGSTIRDADVIIPQVDLFKLNHFDNKAKRTSLKLLEFNMRSDNIEDLPYAVGTVLADDEKDEVISYNFNDVKETLAFYYHCYDSLAFRQDLSAKYGFDCTNLNDTKIGEKFFMQRIEMQNPYAFYEPTGDGKRKMRQTKRSSISIKDCIFPYIQFSKPEFNAVKAWMEKQIITETSGVFSDIEEHLLGEELAKYAEMVTKRAIFKNPLKVNGKGVAQNDFDLDNPEHVNQLRLAKDEFLKLHPKAWFEETRLPVKTQNRVKLTGFYRMAETLNVVIDGFRYDFGVGGIHGSAQGSVHAKKGWRIIDLDVASYYPNMAIANRVYPEHLGESFCDSYEAFYKERGNYAKGTGENLAIKLGLNATYGNSNNKFSPFYDPKYTMTITIGGQLSLCMLMERLRMVAGIKLIQCNTDGFTFYVKDEKMDVMRDNVKRWEGVTGLTMEEAEYSSMYLRDVNNYIGVYTNGKLKQKGAYEYKDLAWHKNMSALVVPMAVESELMGRDSSTEFIYKHRDPFDFMLRTKVDRSSRLILVTGDVTEEQQRICRYYPSVQGGKLIKVMKPLKEDGEDRFMAMEAEYDVRTCNDMSKFNWDVDYSYYVNEANKLLIPFQTELFTELHK